MSEKISDAFNTVQNIKPDCCKKFPKVCSSPVFLILSNHFLRLRAIMIPVMIPQIINAEPGLHTMLTLPVPRAIMGDMRDRINPDRKIVKYLFMLIPGG